jgi:hypothetical protein
MERRCGRDGADYDARPLAKVSPCQSSSAVICRHERLHCSLHPSYRPPASLFPAHRKNDAKSALTTKPTDSQQQQPPTTTTTTSFFRRAALHPLSIDSPAARRQPASCLMNAPAGERFRAFRRFVVRSLVPFLSVVVATERRPSKSSRDLDTRAEFVIRTNLIYVAMTTATQAAAEPLLLLVAIAAACGLDSPASDQTKLNKTGSAADATARRVRRSSPRECTVVDAQMTKTGIVSRIGSRDVGR